MIYKNLELTALTTVAQPKVKVAIDFTDTDVSFTANANILKSDGSPLMGSVVLGVKKADGFVEEFYFADASTQIVDNVATWTTRGLKKSGIDFLTSDPLLIPEKHEEGEEIFVVNSGMVLEQFQQGLEGELEVTVKHETRPLYGASGRSADVVFADATARDLALGATVQNGDKCELVGGIFQGYDGASWVTFGVATPVTASLGVKKVASDFQADIAGGQTVIKLTGNQLDTDITATPTEINQALDGISGNVTDTNLNTLTGGGSADSLHTHNVFELRKKLNEDSFFYRFGLDSADGVIASTTGSGEQNVSVGFGKALFGFGNSFEINFRAKVGGAGDHYMGLITFSGFPPTSGSVTNKHVAFLIDNTTIFGSCADGTTQSTSAITGITVTNWNNYRLVFTTASQAQFYVNGILKATVNTNLPTGTEAIMNISFTSENTPIYVESNFVMKLTP